MGIYEYDPLDLGWPAIRLARLLPWPGSLSHIMREFSTHFMSSRLLINGFKYSK